MAGQDRREFLNVEKCCTSKIFDAFLHSGVHGRQWDSKTYAVAMYTEDRETRWVIAQNQDSNHAEDIIIGYFSRRLASLPSLEVKLFLNYSPCIRCCPLITNFLDQPDSKNLKVEIVFSSFYKVKRPSCDERSVCESGHSIDEEYHDQGVSGLRTLYKTERVVLRTIRGQDWRELATALDIDLSAQDILEAIEGRTEEDGFMETDFQKLVVQ